MSSLSSSRAGDYVKTKRALIRAVEKQSEMDRKMDLLKAELEINGDGGGSISASLAAALSSASHGVRRQSRSGA